MTLFDLNHLNAQKMTYFQHFQHSLQSSLLLISGGILGIIHAICPIIFITAQSDTISYVGPIIKHSKFMD
tara:strand:- start:3337 stop:3546 length:210 start_codon:yes stop_codon:yes gene_type:complete